MAPKGMTPERRERSAKALALRKQGMTYAQIGRELGVSEVTAFNDVKKALHEIIREPAESVRQMELERLDEALLRLNTELGAVVKARKDGDMGLDRSVTAITRITDSQLKIQERRARLLGLEQFKAEVNLDVTQAIHDAIGTVTGASEADLIEAIGEDV